MVFFCACRLLSTLINKLFVTTYILQIFFKLLYVLTIIIVIFIIADNTTYFIYSFYKLVFFIVGCEPFFVTFSGAFLNFYLRTLRQIWNRLYIRYSSFYFRWCEQLIGLKKKHFGLILRKRILYSIFYFRFTNLRFSWPYVVWLRAEEQSLMLFFVIWQNPIVIISSLCHIRVSIINKIRTIALIQIW